MQDKFAALVRTRGFSSKSEPLQLFTYMLKLSTEFNEQYITQQLIDEGKLIEEQDKRDPKTGNLLKVSPEDQHLNFSSNFMDGDEVGEYQFNAVTLWLKFKSILESNGDIDKFLSSPAWMDDPRITSASLNQMKKDSRRVLRSMVKEAEEFEIRKKITDKEDPNYGGYVTVGGGLKPRENSAEFRSPTVAKGKEIYGSRL